MTKKPRGLKWLLTASVAAVAAIGLALAPTFASADTAASTQEQKDVDPAAPADGTPEGAIEWYAEREGSTEFEGMCELAAESAYGTSGVWPSAIDHWNGAKEAGTAHEGDREPPLGAFVFWNTSQYGHVGIADGEGGFWASSVNNAIGYSTDLDYYGDNYLGWAEPGVPSQGSMPEGAKQR